MPVVFTLKGIRWGTASRYQEVNKWMMIRKTAKAGGSIEEFFQCAFRKL
jgi:hypothetical protein